MVWKARQRSFDRVVAVKVYQRELNEDDRRRFLREIVALGLLSDHPSVVTAHDAGILPDDRPYLIMELCPGGSLTRWLQPENRPSSEWVRQVGVRMADALAAVHACGVLHRDVKPANILLDNYGNPRLADFGLVVVAGSEARADESLRVTPAYAPPEAFGRQPVTEFGDVFSLAATLYALLTGSPPRRMGTSVVPGEIADAAREPIEPENTVDPHLMSVLMTALSNDPAARPTAAQFRDQLAENPAPRLPERPPHAALSNPVTPTAGISNGTKPPPKAPLRRGKRRVGMLALVAVLIAAIAFVAAGLIREPTTRSAYPAWTATSAAPSHTADPGTPTSEIASPADAPDRGSTEPKTISLQESALSAETFQTVGIMGTYRRGASLRVQRWEEGAWLDFPLLARADQTGRFTAYVELGRPGRYRLRLLHPDSGVTSEPLVLEVRN